MRHFVCILLALLIPALGGGVSARRLAAVGGSAAPSEDDADGERAPQDNQDSAGAQDLTLVALRTPVAPCTTPPPSFRLRVPAALTPRPGPVRTASRLSTSAAPLRC